MAIELAAERRVLMNSTGLKRLRKEGRLPGIVFGNQKENTMIHVSAKEFQRWTKGGGSGVVSLKVEGVGDIPVLLEAVQRHPVTKEFIHVDFLHVNNNEAVRTKTTIEYVGVASGTKLGGVLQTQSTFIEIQALPLHVPSFITIDISHLNIGDSIRAGDIELPDGVTLLSSDQELLVSITTPRVEVVVEEE
ncbi:50S ribosomal protein L25 [compost metagenome]